MRWSVEPQATRDPYWSADAAMNGDGRSSRKLLLLRFRGCVFLKGRRQTDRKADGPAVEIGGRKSHFL
jgi:hypothetical protein